MSRGDETRALCHSVGSWSAGGRLYTDTLSIAGWIDRDSTPARIAAGKLTSGKSVHNGTEWRYGDAGNAEETDRRIRFGQPTESLLAAYARATHELAGTKLPTAPSVRRRRVWSEIDGEPDVERALSGSPFAYSTRRRVHKGPRVVRLGWNLCASGGEEQTHFSRIAGALVATCDALELAGYAVEISVIDCTLLTPRERESNGLHGAHENFQAFALRTIVKAADQPLDQHGLLAWGLPGAFRDHGFRNLLSYFGDPSGYQSATMGRVPNLSIGLESDRRGGDSEDWIGPAVLEAFDLSACLWQARLDNAPQRFVQSVIARLDPESESDIAEISA